MTSKPPGWHEAGFSASETKTKRVRMKESTFQKIYVVSREFEPFLAPCPLDFFLTNLCLLSLFCRGLHLCEGPE